MAGIVLAAAALLPAASAWAAGSGGQALKLGTADDQSAVTVHVGDTINVSLAPDGLFHFSTPTSSDDTVVRRQGGGGHGHGHGHGHHHKITEGRASFVAVSAGTASLEAIGSIQCPHHHICPAEAGSATPVVARRWHVDVTVE